MATFKQAIITALQKYADFKGRATRSEYWYFYLFSVLTALAASIIDSALFGQAYGPLYSLITLALLIPNFSTGVRRLHDSEHNGWWIIVPIVNIVFLCFKSSEGANIYGEPSS